MNEVQKIKPKRCAVYCRVSSDEGLDQAFNSIDAQKESGHAFIKSQSHEGWISVKDDYDDPAYSGGNMERPALQRLLKDIKAGRIDMIVVYKIDRLSRSLADFAKMVEVFDEHKVSFSAVTQQINSATSMGRLMLNVLLSFAQFEREVTSERIRDKFAASKAKGIFMGGAVPLGYRVENRKLWVIPEEAEVIRFIYEEYARVRRTVDVLQALEQKGIKTRKGKAYSRQSIFAILRNPLYQGLMAHKGKTYPGLHDAIVTQEMVDAVRPMLDLEPTDLRSMGRSRHHPPALLRGLLFAPNGHRMTPGFTVKKANGGHRYQYYQDLHTVRFGKNTDGFGLISATQIEGLVVKHVVAALQSPESIQAVWDEIRKQHADIDEGHVLLAMRNMAQMWPDMFPQEQIRIVRLLIERVQITDSAIEIDWLHSGWLQLACELAPNSIGAELTEMEQA
jgi:DNA invertase Pin-like site-specific DNA recombinase